MPKYRTIWVSDIHLGTRACKHEHLHSFFKENSAETLYLVGDIIDGWKIKRGAYWPQEHTNIIRQILTHSKKGTKIWYVIGNHDEFARKFLDHAPALGNIKIVDEVDHITVSGKKLLILHGDKYDTVIRYHKWLAFLGDKGYDLLVTLNDTVNWIRNKFKMPYWSFSAFIKHKVKSAVSFIGKFEEILSADCKDNGYDGAVSGHIHCPTMKEIDGFHYFNDGDWCESCTALVEEHDGTFKIIKWTDGSGEVLQEKKI
jgi:UDP-2,3-diacylglucosamine pyrophosphatase LpxH